MKLDSSIAAVVTGGASGLGEGTARAIAATGAQVALFDLNAEKGEAIAAEIGGVFCEVDVTSDEKVGAAFEKARAAHGQERLGADSDRIGHVQRRRSHPTSTAMVNDLAVSRLGPFAGRNFRGVAFGPTPPWSLDFVRRRQHYWIWYRAMARREDAQGLK